MFKTGADPKNFEWGKLAAAELPKTEPVTSDSTPPNDTDLEKSAKKVKVKKKKSLAPQPPSTEKAECDVIENPDANVINDKSDKTKDPAAIDNDLNCDEKECISVSITYLSLIESEKETSTEEIINTRGGETKESLA